MNIASYFPSTQFSNDEMEQLGWPAQKIFLKTGISVRRVASENEFALDLAEQACLDLFQRDSVTKEQVDYLIYCTQSPDSILPNNVSFLQQRLGLNNQMGSFDYNQGCTGYIYGLSIAKGLLASYQAQNILLVTADTYTKYIAKEDRGNRVIFGDGATATLLTQDDLSKLGDFVFGTDGQGAGNLCVKNSGLRQSQELGADYLYMDGPEIFSFVIREVPSLIDRLLEKAKLTLSEIDHFIFHQANTYMLEHVREKLCLPKEKFHVYLENVGNTVSSSIPIVLESKFRESKLASGQRVMLVGFGIGYSLAANLLCL